jgi:thiol-disulfide isomerase/thioredoxin
MSIPVQAVRADGVRLTFVPHECAKNSLVGTSTLLGPCQVDLQTVDRLLFGEMIGEAADEPTYEVWKLQYAVEPRYVRDDAESNPMAFGLESGLVAKPAPDFRLELLEGGHFELSTEKGHIVVLDFWASWCAPCMQGMPEVNAVTQEFKDNDVKFVAINMQEDRLTIASALERLSINPPIALDIDGATAEKFEVSAIPQIVVVDADGNVARLFIGADSNFADQLRQTLQQLSEKKPQSSDNRRSP